MNNNKHIIIMFLFMLKIRKLILVNFGIKELVFKQQRKLH
jgi:hypothetical protein